VRAQFQNSADGIGKFCRWSIDNVQIK